jgi:hypothetical protein
MKLQKTVVIISGIYTAKLISIVFAEETIKYSFNQKIKAINATYRLYDKSLTKKN